jgi:hypothetical protein
VHRAPARRSGACPGCCRRSRDSRRHIARVDQDATSLVTFVKGSALRASPTAPLTATPRSGDAGAWFWRQANVNSARPNDGYPSTTPQLRQLASAESSPYCEGPFHLSKEASTMSELSSLVILGAGLTSVVTITKWPAVRRRVGRLKQPPVRRSVKQTCPRRLVSGPRRAHPAGRTPPSRLVAAAAHVGGCEWRSRRPDVDQGQDELGHRHRPLTLK